MDDVKEDSLNLVSAKDSNLLLRSVILTQAGL